MVRMVPVIFLGLMLLTACQQRMQSERINVRQTALSLLGPYQPGRSFEDMRAASEIRQFEGGEMHVYRLTSVGGSIIQLYVDPMTREIWRVESEDPNFIISECGLIGKTLLQLEHCFPSLNVIEGHEEGNYLTAIVHQADHLLIAYDFDTGEDLNDSSERSGETGSPKSVRLRIQRY